MTAGANGLLDITGAAPGTLTGNYQAECQRGIGGGGMGFRRDHPDRGWRQQLGLRMLSNGASAYLEVGATNTNSALKGLTTIASNGDVANGGRRIGDHHGRADSRRRRAIVRGCNSGDGGSSLTLGGSLTNSGTCKSATSTWARASTVNVTGTYTGTGGTVLVQGGNAAGANGLLNVTGAAPGTLTGNYQLNANGDRRRWNGVRAGSPHREWQHESGDVCLSNGANAYLEVGATNSNSALKRLTTIASNGELQLANGASVTTTGALTVPAAGSCTWTPAARGGSSLNIGGALTNGTARAGRQLLHDCGEHGQCRRKPQNSSTGRYKWPAATAGAAKAVLEVTGPIAGEFRSHQPLWQRRRRRTGNQRQCDTQRGRQGQAFQHRDQCHYRRLPPATR